MDGVTTASWNGPFLRWIGHHQSTHPHGRSLCPRVTLKILKINKPRLNEPFFSLEPDEVKVRLGEFDFNVNSTFEVDFAVEKIISHSAYNRRTLAHDIAILKLKEPIKFSQLVRG